MTSQTRKLPGTESVNAAGKWMERWSILPREVSSAEESAVTTNGEKSAAAIVPVKRLGRAKPDEVEVYATYRP